MLLDEDMKYEIIDWVLKVIFLIPMAIISVLFLVGGAILVLSINYIICIKRKIKFKYLKLIRRLRRG